MKLIEEIMSECGDMILRVFHSNNVTYSSGLNFENLLEIIQNNNDQESMKVMNMLNEKFMKRIMESFINMEHRPNNNKNKSKQTKENVMTPTKDKKIDIKCLICNDLIFADSENGKNEELLSLLSLPNYNSSFENSENYNKIQFDNSNSDNLVNSNSDPEVKTLYSNETISFKYNYLLNKFL